MTFNDLIKPQTDSTNRMSDEASMNWITSQDLKKSGITSSMFRKSWLRRNSNVTQQGWFSVLRGVAEGAGLTVTLEG